MLRAHSVMDSLCFIVQRQLWYRLSVSLTSDWCQVARLVIDAASTALRQISREVFSLTIGPDADIGQALCEGAELTFDASIMSRYASVRLSMISL